MACLLCYGTNDDLIDLMSDEAKKCQIADVLFKYFSFCLNVSLINELNTIYHLINNQISNM